MTPLLLWSALLITTILEPMDANSTSIPSTSKSLPSVSSIQNVQTNNETNSSVASTFTTTRTVPTTTKVSTSAFPTTTTTAKHSPCPCDCLQGIAKGNDTIGFLVFLGLTLGCLILLITTMTLACKLCHIQRDYRDYVICQVQTSAANGRTKANEPNESSIMMSEVFNDEGATRDAGENNQSKEKVEETANADNAQSSVDKIDAPDNSDTNESTANKATAANKAEQPESSVEEATKNTVAAGTAVAADNKAKDETKNVADENKSDTEAAT